ncbi:hypothetical protein O181_064181 [Austropuccinia psidii MF-1]|uniref:Uncharacterized protein n=1 Tax=Austropuccinia psidii MF-1 TaxID=1389203 RepID=A0A9Q3ET68_9BASI|nr:hypothetical protein [Austropuccinia psidii MF-1]
MFKVAIEICLQTVRKIVANLHSLWLAALIDSHPPPSALPFVRPSLISINHPSRYLSRRRPLSDIADIPYSALLSGSIES